MVKIQNYKSTFIPIVSQIAADLYNLEITAKLLTSSSEMDDTHCGFPIALEFDNQTADGELNNLCCSYQPGPKASMTSFNVDILLGLFPFHVLLDDELKIVSVGTCLLSHNWVPLSHSMDEVFWFGQNEIIKKEKVKFANQEFCLLHY